MENYLKNSQSYIYNAILKHGHVNFALIIIEYCGKEKCIEREDYYLSSFTHEYNILEKAGSRLGSTHNNKGENNPMFGQNHSEETRKKISDAMVGNTNSKNHPNSQQIQVFDEKTNQTTTYNSIREAARALNINKSSIVTYFANNQQKPYKGRYTFNNI
jgi:group I intron endonuclease